MRLLLRIAQKFLFSKNNDHFLSFITWVSVTGVALGVLALTVVTSVINGFEGELEKSITGVNGDLILYTRGNPILRADEIIEKMQRVLPDMKAVTPSFVTELMVAGPDAVSGAVLEGIDSESLGEVTYIPKRIIRGRLPEKEGEVMLGYALAQKIGAKVENDIKLIVPFSATEKGGKFGSNFSPNAMRVTVVGIVNLGMHKYDSKLVYATLPSVQNFLNQPNRVTTFKIRLKKGVDSLEASRDLYDNFGYPFVARNWAQLNRNLFYAIRLEKAVISIILTAIVIVAAFNVVSTLMMMIHDKTREIAILKAMGFRPSQSFQLFVFIGMVIGVLGTLLGVAAGTGVNYLIASSHFVALPAEIYNIGFLPVVMKWDEITIIIVFALLIAFLATLYPAIRISMRSPLDGLRYE